MHDSITRFGWEQNNKSMQEKELPVLCVGSFIWSTLGT